MAPVLGFLALLAAAPALAAQAPADTAGAGADVRFLQHMIVHHRQALEMTALAPERAAGETVQRLAERIDISQVYEIGRMERLLRSRGAAVPGAHTHHAAEHATMPGLLSPEEMARLRAATGAEFDRLFLAFMIRHHEGAITMVRELFAAPRGGQDPEMYHLASEIETDQRIEIDRMRRMQSAPPPGADPR